MNAAAQPQEPAEVVDVGELVPIAEAHVHPATKAVFRTERMSRNMRENRFRNRMVEFGVFRAYGRCVNVVPSALNRWAAECMRD